MLRQQESDIAADQIAEQPRLVWAERHIRFQVSAMPDASASGRRKIAMKGGNPIQNLVERLTLVMAAQICCDFIEIFALHSASVRIETLKGR